MVAASVAAEVAPKIAVLPASESLARAVVAGGGAPADPADADAIVWANPHDPAELGVVLARSAARWVQLPVAGVERFVEAGVLDASRAWTCAKGIYGPACAEHALGLILMGARALHVHARAHTWQAEPGTRLVEGTTALIIGTGGIGRALAGMLAPLSVRVLAVNRSGSPMPGAARTEPVARMAPLLAEADWVVVAAASTPQTRRLIDAAALTGMKAEAWLINVARGELVDTDALVSALTAGRIGGAALDVTDPEPLPDDHPLWRMPNVVITSHLANNARVAIGRLSGMVERNVRRFAAGERLEGLVDPTLGY